MSIEIQALSLSYGNKRVLHGITLQAQAGQLLGIVGPNGSGKSSLIKAVAGLLPFEGALRFNGHTSRPLSVGYMPQDLQVPSALTVLEVVLLGRIRNLRLKVQSNDLSAVHEVLQMLGIDALAGRYMNELSGGQRQMVFLAQALVSEPKVLLLDEPISALDICHQLEVLDVVRRITLERGLTTMVVLHDLNATARFCDVVALLQTGQLLACGVPGEVLTVSLVARAFDVDTEALVCSDGVGVLVPRHSRRVVAQPDRST